MHTLLGRNHAYTTNGAHQNLLVNILTQSTQGGLCVTVLHTPTATLKARVLVGRQNKASLKMAFDTPMDDWFILL